MSQFPLLAFDHYWAMWNEHDLSLVRGHLDRAVTDDFIFCDPLHWYVGRDALEDNVKTFRTQYPKASFNMGSGFDHHHNRYRYQWKLMVGSRLLVLGLDIVTVNDNGLLERIDGFFGPIPELDGR
jgi:hypothetical protein